MENYQITETKIQAFADYLRSAENSAGTIDKYLRDVRRFAKWLASRPVSRELAAEWKNALLKENCAPVTVNSMLAAVNRFLKFAGFDFRMRFLRIQRKLFRDPSRELNRSEYMRLLETAYQSGKKRLGLLIETICSAGIRVSEIPYITVRAAQCRKAEISLKGKIRIILLPKKLCQKLLQYAKEKKIVSGKIFLTRNNTELSRKQIWAEMKALCKGAKIAPGKVFPHNLRHLFARTFYQESQDIAKLADVLGHSSIETTRIYLISSGEEHSRKLNRLNLLL
ncbi:MAG TPA: tyrosine-type recombinase/integrase [Candidatus Merdivicinus excrementipullorum]|uniref:Tyrosine-type recombinase/integrase n=1 Tax=Candidatus Merdivicinus excrementipullorum TaxID=2840867 RepID=A0A9D1FKX2_9FIRM|nr:tyrosine-type recombinase/integrase [Candidatus Merdivicinus excrementipullorum]